MATTEPSAFSIYDRHPLVRFSVYTHIQVQVIRDLSAEIFALLDTAFASDQIDGESFHKVYGRFWLWVLGAYEVTRTMSQYKTCFSERHNAEVAAFKSMVAVIRMPFAKQELKGISQPIENEASVSGFDQVTKDFTFLVGKKELSIRSLLSEFERLVQLVKPEDVLCDLRDAQR